MNEAVEITLRIDRKLGGLLLEVEGEVSSEEEIATLLGYMVYLIKRAQQYGGTWVQSTKMKENRPNQISHTFAFPNAAAKEQFYLELQNDNKETVP